MSERTIFTVTDLKQYSYCARIVFYTYCLPLIRPTTFKMEAGVAAHDQARKLERRRTLRAFDLGAAVKHFDVSLGSDTLGLQGRIDLVLEVKQAGERELLPVDYKNTRRAAGRHLKRQLATYGLMLEECWAAPAPRGFLYFLPERRAEEIVLTARLREEARTTVEEMRTMVEREVMPPPPKSRRPCLNCEFRRFCNDVL